MPKPEDWASPEKGGVAMKTGHGNERIPTMRKSFWIISVLFAAVGVVNVHAETFPIIFAQTLGTDPVPIGTIDYNSTVPTISAAIVWDGLTFDISDATLTANIGLEPFLTTVDPQCSGVSAEAATLNVFEGCAGQLIYSATYVPIRAFGDFLLGWGTNLTTFNNYPTSGVFNGTLNFSSATPPFANDSGTWSLPTTGPMVTPEPGTFFMLGTGILAVGTITKRKFLC